MSLPKARPSLIDGGDCPVPLETLGALYRGDREAVAAIVAGIPNLTRARLAAYLYGKSHLHALGLRLAATCAEADLVQVAGHAGAVLFAQARQPGPPTSEPRVSGPRRISLAGSGSLARGVD
ncbi:hypothetical protein OPKNFCMD_2328 [Methylobacterium crusticola]|uniref:DUF3572 family protein n=1 Tax=Methylobacterium crusticola TaxID=1697972 RepID=A0ABQ4QY74_9HYPH|nr:hypothetical protein [Methylobacterium crusticola]GJD49596.1 hypothetical protein OPKNFCMD_2328 [Methylobacterium crusticola]